MIRQMIYEKLKEPEDLMDFIPKDNDQVSQVEVHNYHEFMVKKGLKENGGTPDGEYPLYDAILIDEGQDFEPEWLKVISQCLNPETKSLLIVEDRAQNIYKRKWNLLQQTGLDFRGRSKYLNINYRNTGEILYFAWNFYQANSNVGDKTDKIGDAAEIILPRQTQRTGPEPIVYKASNFEEEIGFVCKSMAKLHQQHQVPYSEMIILYRIKKDQSTPYVDILKSVLEKHGLPYFWISENNVTKRKFIKKEDSIKISTIESAKGLDFRAVFVIHIENMPFKLVEDDEREAALLYIAMTRAVEWLFLSYSGQSKYTQYLETVSHVYQATAKNLTEEKVPALVNEVAATYEVETEEKTERGESGTDMAKTTFDVHAFTKENHKSLVFETLRGWRKQKADLNKVKPYQIIEDKSLLILATFIPHTQEEFLSLPYFKLKRWENYGEELLDILKKYEKSYDIFEYFPRYVFVAPPKQEKVEEVTVKEEPIKEENPSLFQKIMGIFK